MSPPDAFLSPSFCIFTLPAILPLIHKNRFQMRFNIYKSGSAFVVFFKRNSISQSQTTQFKTYEQAEEYICAMLAAYRGEVTGE